MADKLLIVMMNSNPQEAIEVVPPISQAIVAAAMEFDVEMVFTGRSAGLLKKGVAAQIPLAADRTATVHDLIKEAVQAGVHFKVCSAGIEQWGEDIIPEVEETVGGAYIISEAMDNATVTFTY
jgi:predicted peroxiredoxin